MTVRDWLDAALLVVLTIVSIGRWAEAREQNERISAKDVKAVENGYKAVEARFAAEHVRLWEEIARNRDHWHTDMVPWRQGIVERLVGLEAQVHALSAEIARLVRLSDRFRRD